MINKLILKWPRSKFYQFSLIWNCKMNKSEVWKNDQITKNWNKLYNFLLIKAVVLKLKLWWIL
jgi:hypothetical protein